MAQEVKAYRANDGSLHEDICTAATRDVELLVQGSPLSENQPFARQLVEWLCENSAAVRETLAAHALACPKEGIEGVLFGEPVKAGTLEHRKAMAIGQMQRLGDPAKDWLERHGFANLKHFVDTAPEKQVEEWEHFAQEPAKAEKRPGIDKQATSADLTPHMNSCNARLTGYFHDCSCGAFSTAQIAKYHDQHEGID